MISLWFLNGWIPWMGLLHRAGVELLYKDILVAGNVLTPGDSQQEFACEGFQCRGSFTVSDGHPRWAASKKYINTWQAMPGFFSFLFFFKLSEVSWRHAMLWCFRINKPLFFQNVVHVSCNGTWHHSYMEVHRIIIDSGNCLGQLWWIFIVCLYFCLCLSHCCISWKMWIHCVTFENGATFYPVGLHTRVMMQNHGRMCSMRIPDLHPAPFRFCHPWHPSGVREKVQLPSMSQCMCTWRPRCVIWSAALLKSATEHVTQRLSGKHSVLY